MRDSPGPAAGGDLLGQALLYAGGDLSAADAEAFEKRLENDQAAREALCAAVGLVRPTAADPAYRAAVRRRLRPPVWQRLLGRQTYRGHPVLWSGLGAAAALLLTLGVTGVRRHPADLPAAPPPAAEAAREEPPEPSPADMADVWAELHEHQHLTRAHEEEMRRRNRPEGRSLRDEERRLHPLGHPMGKHP
jgi:hypothetical protein